MPPSIKKKRRFRRFSYVLRHLFFALPLFLLIFSLSLIILRLSPLSSWSLLLFFVNLFLIFFFLFRLFIKKNIISFLLAFYFTLLFVFRAFHLLHWLNFILLTISTLSIGIFLSR